MKASADMRVLVTGAAGFIGRPLCGLLSEAGAEVHGTGRRADAEVAVQWHALDLLDATPRRALLQRLRPTHLIHLAWTTSHGRYWQDPANADWLEASTALLQEFAEAGGRHAVLAGSCAELEGPQALPPSPYGQAKVELRARAEALGLAMAWGRIYFPFGAGEQPQRLVPSLACRLLRGELAETGPAGLLRDFVHVDDLATMLQLLSQGEHRGLFELCSGQAVAIGEVASELATLAGRPDLLRLGALPGRPGEPERLVGSDAALREVGWAGAAPLRERLSQSLEWWRGQLEAAR